MGNNIVCVGEHECTGCGACDNKCPTDAITMKYNEEGFLYPIVNKQKCISCESCIEVCPELAKERIYQKDNSYVVMIEDDLQEVDSSRRIITLLAEKIYAQGGAVCGAIHNEDYRNVVHIVSENSKDMEKFHGGEYVQSSIEKTFSQVEGILKVGGEVLFIGIPCQVAGLYAYLGKDYENLYTIDSICHGTSSTFAYQSYIGEVANGRKIQKLNLKDKAADKIMMSVSIDFENGEAYHETYDKNKWIDAFSKGMMNRLCCRNCHYTQGRKVADITIGNIYDFGFLGEKFDGFRKSSFVIVNSKKGEKLYSQIEDRLKSVNGILLNSTIQQNVNLSYSVQQASGRAYFFNHLSDKGFHKAWWYGNEWRYDVGLIGWWFSANYGSVLTYYALGNILKDMNLLSIMLPIPKKDGTQWEEATKKNVEFMQKYFKVANPRKYENIQEYNQFCDSFLVGSDQLWVPNYNNLLGYTFYLDFADSSKRKVAYSTSLGYEEYKGSEEDKQIVRTLLSRFDAVSVREISGVEICKKEFGVNAVRTLDPVFLCDKKYYDNLAVDVNLEADMPYILCYILDPTDEKKEAIRRLEKKYNMKSKVILDIRNYEQSYSIWKEENIIKNPSIEEFIFWIKKCTFLFTDSHHGVCFGIIYHKNFAAVVNARRGATRFYSLFKLLDMQEFLLEEGSLLEDLEVIPDIEYRKIDDKLEKEKENSRHWIMENLSYRSNVKKESTKEDLFAKYFNLAKRLEVMNKERVIKSPIVRSNTLENNPDFIKIRILATLLRDYGIRHVILSPGGRDVPLVRMFEYNESEFILHRVTDERSAAYYGLGIAAQLQQPAICICTSGTAASNYLPAVTEAYYTGIPLIVVTADRREVYHEQGEDQTIPQKNIYRDVVKKAISLPESTGFYAEYQTRRDISDCILETTHNGCGPVHINISIEDISMGAKESINSWKLLPRITPHLLRVGANDSEATVMQWVNALKESKRILIVYGQNAILSERQRRNIEKFTSKFNCVIITDFISNLECPYSLKPYNMLQAISNNEFNEKLSPDILITVGGKRLMNDPLTPKVRWGLKNIRHWSVNPNGKVKDFYFRLTSIIEMSQDYFFEWFSDHAGNSKNDGIYYSKWRKLTEEYRVTTSTSFNAHYIQSKFIPAVPPNSLLHLAVGQSFFDVRRYSLDKTVEVFCNMGTNGIDGCTSTFMGQCAVVKDKLCFLLVGDLSFFYDMNSIWNKELSKNIRILMVNNNGSGLLRGHNLKGVTAAHNTEAKGWVESTGFTYLLARNKEEFDMKLGYFLSDESQQPLFFEVFCE